MVHLSNKNCISLFISNGDLSLKIIIGIGRAFLFVGGVLVICSLVNVIIIVVKVKLNIGIVIRLCCLCLLYFIVVHYYWHF